MKARPGHARLNRALAAQQLALHRARLAEYHAMQQTLPDEGARLTLGMGRRDEVASVDFWSEILEGAGAERKG